MQCSVFGSVCPQETITIEVCRVCLVGDIDKNNQMMLSLFEPHQELSIGSQLTALADVKVSAGDGLPDRICRGCLAELRAALLFRQKCRHSDRQLRGLPSEPAEVKKEEPEQYEDECYLESSYEQEDVICKTEKVEIKPVIMKQEEAKTRNDIVSANRHVECHDCGETFKSKCKLRVHWKKNHKKRACEICKRVFQSFKSYNKHQQSRNISCLSVASEGVRIEGEGRTRVFHCSFCDYNTKHIGYMRNHSVVHNARKPYACDLCPKKFSQKGTLLYHKREVHSMCLESNGGFPCFACGKIFKTRVSARHHISLTHNTQKYQCDLCNKIFKRKQSIIAHLQRHTGMKNYICDICGASFFTQSNLRNHKVGKHRDELFLQTLQCKFCSYIAKSQISIKKHQKLHSGTNLVCTKLRCGQVFADEHRFRIHEMMHLDGKFHECSFCDKRFKRIRNLATHMKNQHKSEENIAFNINVKLEK